MTYTGVERCFLVVCLLLGLCAMCAPTARSECPLYPLPTSRFGVDLNPFLGRITDYDVGALHIGWYSDWSTSLEPLQPGGLEYVQLIWVDQGHWKISEDPDQLAALRVRVDANPGTVWMIGNEPECPNLPGGGRSTPEQYAAVYHELYEYIKLRDPSAQVAIGGVVLPTPLRLKWLDRVLDYYKTTYGEAMPVDVWTIHLLILPEMSRRCPPQVCGDSLWGAGIPVGLDEPYGLLYNVVDTWDITIFRGLVRDFRVWMNARGERNKPLWITEYGVLLSESYGATAARVNAFMTASFDFMLNTRDANLGHPADSNLLVQRWAWNSLNDNPSSFNGGLFDYRDKTFPGTTTAFGQSFMAYTSSLLSGSACITGTVHLDGRPAIPHASHVTTATLTLFRVDCPQTQPDVRSVVTDDSGVFNLCDVPPGTYDIVVKTYNTLANRTNGVVLAAGSTRVDLGELRCGDANNDNRVTVLDFSLLATTFGSAGGSSNYDDRPDFDGNGSVNLSDFWLLATHFGDLGAPQGR